MSKSIDQLDRTYDYDFSPSKDYLDSLPDIQNTSKCKQTPIDFVGIQNFKIPIRIKEKSGGTQEVCASITGSVSLEAEKRGINMSRIIRTFYKSKDDIFDIDVLEKVLRDYKKDLDSFDAHILFSFEYRIWQEALRSVKENGEKEGGWQYYNICFDVNLDHNDEFKKVMYIDYIYSSACPCSDALTVHNACMRGKAGIPHSQRSIARIAIDFTDDVWIEDLVGMCNKALATETQVFVKRIDEQAFSEMNAAYTKFVEDAIRQLKDELNNCNNIQDFKIICLHAESLHSHNAIACTTKGIKNSIFSHHVNAYEWRDLSTSL